MDWEAFLADWRACYRPGMERINRGEAPWTTVEQIYRAGLRAGLRALLPRYAIVGPDEADVERLVRTWWRLRPWPDAVSGLTRLRRHYVISPLSNASFVGMVRLAKFAGLPWDCIITAENVGWYKPRPEVYRTAVSLLGLRPAQVMLVAAHNYDLRAAQAEGLRTAGYATAVVTSGGIGSFDLAEGILARGEADAVAAARQTLADPDWFRKIRLGHLVRRCEFTNYCEGLDQRHKQVTCKLWDRAWEPGDPTLRLADDGKRRLHAPPWSPPRA